MTACKGTLLDSDVLASWPRTGCHLYDMDMSAEIYLCVLSRVLHLSCIPETESKLYSTSEVFACIVLQKFSYLSYVHR
jgi:hypothetical protein